MPSTIQDNNKRIAKNTLLLYFRMLLTMAISLYTSRLVLATLGEVDFGIYNVVGGFVMMFAVISGAMTAGTQRFISFEIGKKEGSNVKRIFTTVVIIHIVLALIVLLAAETTGVWFLNVHMNFPEDRYIAANWVFQFSLLTFLVNIISVPYNAAIVAYERMKAFAYISIIEVSLKLLVVYLLLISGFDKLILYAFLLSLIAVIIRIIYGIYCKRHFHECRCDFKWDKEIGYKIFSFSGWNMIGSLAGVAKEQGINVLLNIFFGAPVNAARGVAYQVMHALNAFVSNFQLAMNPQIVKRYASNEKDEMFKLVFRGSKLSFLLMLTLALPVIIEAPFILNIWLEEVPEYTAIFVRLVLVTALIDSLSGTLIASMHASGKVRNYQIVVGCLSLMTLPIAYVFFKFGYPPYIAMCVSILISSLCLLARLLMLRLTIALPVGGYMHQVLFKIIIVVVLSLIVPLIVFSYIKEGWMAFVVVCTVTAISTLSISYLVGLTANERNFFKKEILYRIQHIKK